jgi:uncharacterized phage protein (TIGR01671 family)
MNREIKFRGISYLTNNWEFGYLSKRESLYFIKNTYNVKENTIGQFTGLLDKNRNEIYEGDLVQHDAWDYPFEVIFNQEKARFVCKMKTGLTQYIDCQNLVVVGNIHETVSA